ncbi:MAG: hypothetical protein LKH08_05105 [Atopobiaceae bacterium]|jgi:hypothetical protein|nr:hypothetical protein [Atopobiaceae bacterium]MCH4120356.1 hypothetical protein [Atopobiaceae bacterium]MCI1389435.1 hypothetical protein [Atopobiaceae bacterium]MCI1432284.1 hypothetical protein [Atopobiaceae bacterium]MCI1470742.1 hypothetical protein [Atopobiaceae bacterium]
MVDAVILVAVVIGMVFAVRHAAQVFSGKKDCCSGGSNGTCPKCAAKKQAAAEPSCPNCASER